jgi:hypothetical protein
MIFFLFLLLMEGSGSGKELIDLDPDPGGPKMYESYGSGSGRPVKQSV